MDLSNIGVGLAFLGGLVSFLSPCVFSLAPAYVGYLGSRTVSPEGVTVENRWETFLHGAAFVLGFSAVFITLGLFASVAGRLLFDARWLLTKIGGALVIVLGLHTMGVFHLPFLEYDTRRQQAPDRRFGYLSSALMGVFFSAGWSPCIGPVLGAVMTLAANSSDLWQGAALLAAYSLGMGVPFLAVAAGAGQVSAWMGKFKKYMRYMSIAAGALLIAIGVLLLTGSLGVLATSPISYDAQIALDDGLMRFWSSLTGGQ